MMNFLSYKNIQRGFTLMEVMVSVTIFTIIVTVGIVALITINDSYRKSQNDRQAIDSLTYTLESMSRRIRTARSWAPPVSTEEFTFVDQEGIELSYYWNQSDKKIMMEIIDTTGCTSPCASSINTGIYDLTPDSVQITDSPTSGNFPGGGLRFVTLPTGGTGSLAQSYLQINLGGVVARGKQESKFWFQTGVSKRILDSAL